MLNVAATSAGLGCKIYPKFMRRFQKGLVVTYARLVFIGQADITANGNIVNACKAFVWAVEVVKAMKPERLCELQPGMYRMQWFLFHIVQFTSNFQQTQLF